MPIWTSVPGTMAVPDTLGHTRVFTSHLLSMYRDQSQGALQGLSRVCKGEEEATNSLNRKNAMVPSGGI